MFLEIVLNVDLFPVTYTIALFNAKVSPVKQSSEKLVLVTCVKIESVFLPVKAILGNTRVTQFHRLLSFLHSSFKTNWP